MPLLRPAKNVIVGDVVVYTSPWDARLYLAEVDGFYQDGPYAVHTTEEPFFIFKPNPACPSHGHYWASPHGEAAYGSELVGIVCGQCDTNLLHQTRKLFRQIITSCPSYFLSLLEQ